MLISLSLSSSTRIPSSILFAIRGGKHEDEDEDEDGDFGRLLTHGCKDRGIEELE